MSSYEETQWFDSEVRPCEEALRAYLLKRFPVIVDHDDLVQESYTRVVRAKRNGQLTCAKAFLFTVARNLAIDMIRRRKTNQHEPIADFGDESLPDDLLVDESSGTPDSLERLQRREILIDAMASLPQRCREVMMLRHLDGLSYKQIAERLAISPNTVRVHIVKGVKDCASYFRKHGLLDSHFEAASPTRKSFP